MVYTIDPTISQESVIAKLETIVFSWGSPEVYPDGLHDNLDVGKFPDGSIKPFIVIHFGSVHRHWRGRAMGGHKLDAHRVSVSIECVANNPTTIRLMRNFISNELVGWSPDRASAMVKSESAWEEPRALIDIQNRPTRWVANDRFSFGLSAHQAP